MKSRSEGSLQPDSLKAVNHRGGLEETTSVRTSGLFFSRPARGGESSQGLETFTEDSQQEALGLQKQRTGYCAWKGLPVLTLLQDHTLRGTIPTPEKSLAPFIFIDTMVRSQWSATAYN